jgi:hypothetical protein
MFRFIAKFLKGLILGWIASLMMMLVKKMLSKAFGVDAINPQNAPQQRKQNPYKNNSANQNSLNIVETIWVGMSTAQLIKSFGPALTKQYRGTQEIWTYLNMSGQGTQTAIAVENGIIVNWQVNRPDAAAHFATPAP